MLTMYFPIFPDQPSLLNKRFRVTPHIALLVDNHWHRICWHHVRHPLYYTGMVCIYVPEWNTISHPQNKNQTATFPSYWTIYIYIFFLNFHDMRYESSTMTIWNDTIFSSRITLNIHHTTRPRLLTVEISFFRQMYFNLWLPINIKINERKIGRWSHFLRKRTNVLLK